MIDPARGPIHYAGAVPTAAAVRRDGAEQSKPGAKSGTDLKALKHQSVRGGAVTLVAQGISIGIQLASTIVLARLLSPNDYGIMSMVTTITAFAGLFRDLGLSSAAIQKKELTHAQQSNLFWINAGMGALLSVVVAGSAPLVAWFYKRHEVFWVTVALASTFFISSLGTQHGALLVRQMRFARQAGASIAGAATGFGLAVALAMAGCGYWALVWGGLANSLVTTSLLIILSPFRPGVPARRAGLRGILKFGAHITAFDFVNYFQRNLDNLLVGRVWGTGALGVYSRAYSLLMFPIASLRSPINAVAFPAMSRLQNEPEALRSYYLRITSLLAFTAMPLTAFLFVASKPIIALALGAKWFGVIPIFSYLALAAFIQPAAGFAGSLLLSLGQSDRYFRCGLFNAAAMSLGIVIGVHWGPTGVALGYAIANYVVLYPWLRWAFRDTPVRFRDFAEACAYPAMMSVLASALALACKPWIAGFHPAAQLAVLGGVFGLVGIPMLLLTDWGRKHGVFLLGLIEHFRGKARLEAQP